MIIWIMGMMATWAFLKRIDGECELKWYKIISIIVFWPIFWGGILGQLLRKFGVDDIQKPSEE